MIPQPTMNRANQPTSAPNVIGSLGGGGFVLVVGGVMTGDGLADGVGEGVADGVGHWPSTHGSGVGVAVGVGEGDGDALGVGLGDGDGEGVADGVGVGEGDGEGDGVAHLAYPVVRTAWSPAQRT